MNHEFIELLRIHEEFIFQYKGKKYEIVYCDDKGNAVLSLYLSDSYWGTFMQAFKDADDFLENAEIDGVKAKDFIKDVIL